jgi:E3 ubiquitin-protein ligase SHPRH
MLELMRKEFSAMLALWRGKKDESYAYDEIDMAVTRIRLRLPGETVEANEEAFKLSEYDVEPMQLKLQTDKVVADAAYKKAQGQLAYLRNLSRIRSQGSDTNQEEELCPICTENLGNNKVVFYCGHTLCVDCTLAIMRNAKLTIKCPTCRTRVNLSELSYIMDKKDQKEEEVEEDIPVKGSYGTKIEAIVKTLIKISRKDPTAKSLIFSQVKRSVHKVNLPYF